jgi:glucose-1-phosphate thymidylyltransferase
VKGIILAGGNGSRLYPLSLYLNKQLQPVYDKPMVYYPLTTLIENGIQEICLISSAAEIGKFEALLGDGSRLGLKMEYRVQPEPKGIAQALIIAETFSADDEVALILGDNIFYVADELAEGFQNFGNGGTVFACRVNEPERYGVVVLDDNYVPVKLIEKPKNKESYYATVGLYLYEPHIAEYAKRQKPSARGELEITDLNQTLLEEQSLDVVLFNRNSVWLDAGTSSSFQEASDFIRAVEKRQGIKVGCPEEASYKQGFISAEDLKKTIKSLPNCEYREYLEKIL